MGYLGNQITTVFPTSISVDTATIATANISNQLTDANMASGSVIQVVSSSTSTQVNVASTTLTDTGLTASITPSSTSSKILIIISQSIGSDRDTTNGSVGLQLLRGSTNIQSQTYMAFIEAGGSSAVKNIGAWAITHLDSPNTTSSTTYKTQGNINATSYNGTARFQWDSGVSHITLMEISA